MDPTRPVSVYVVTVEGVAAGTIVRALEREGVEAAVTWGPLPNGALTKPGRFDLLVVFEPEADRLTDSRYLELRAAVGDAALVVLCPPHRERPQTLLWAGVNGIVYEPATVGAIGAAIRLVLDGYVVLPRTLRGAVHPPPLSPRERQLMALVVEGLTNREIAQRLYLAESTVKRHLSRIFRRLGVSNRREAVVTMLASEPGPVSNGQERFVRTLTS